MATNVGHIEKGIPLPDQNRRKKGESIYPFREMQVGDSILVGKNGRKSWAFLHAATLKAQKNIGIKLTTREIDGDNKRVWRTE